MHTLIIEWCMKELQGYWVQQGFDYDYAAYYVFLIFTPVLILVAWGTTEFIDTPCKDLAIDIDLNARVAWKPRKDKPGVPQLGAWRFSITNWKVYTIVIYLLSLFVVTETYQSFNGNRERIAAMGA